MNKDRPSKDIDLLAGIEGGCSAKIAPGVLKEIVKSIPQLKSPSLMVGNDTSDDALVYKLNDQQAIIQTTDFFPPVCSDPYTFGEIVAANALSDVFAMGGEAITALNLVMFPSDKMDIHILKDILQGGAEKVKEAGAVLAGGHTIDDQSIKYGLAVTGTVHPDRVITNHRAAEGDLLILTKGIGTGVLISGNKVGEASAEDYQRALESMKQLNLAGSRIMQKYDVKSATDITGFGLCGHGLEMAEASGVSFIIEGKKLPILSGAEELVDMGCIPGASFRNLKFVEHRVSFGEEVNYKQKMLSVDAQTSGGLLICVKPEDGEKIISDLHEAGYGESALIGRVSKLSSDEKHLSVI